MRRRIYSANHIANNSQPKNIRRVNTEFSKSQFQDSHKVAHPKVKNSFLKKSRPWAKSLAKDPQQIMEQNLNLKSFINGLQEQLVLQRGKLQMSKKKNQKVERQMNRQFEKQIYYSGKNPNGYLVSGVKGQYENIKNLYDRKCTQFQDVIRTIEYSDVQEMRTYIEVLQAENNSLVEQMQLFNHIKNSNSQLHSQDSQLLNRPTGHRSFYPKGQKMYSEPTEEKSESSTNNIDVLVHQLTIQKTNLNRATTIIEKYSDKLSLLSKQIEQLLKKVEFLEKLVIEKDNNEHQARRDLKKVQRDKSQVQQEFDKANKRISHNQDQFRLKLAIALEKETKKYQIQRSIFTSSLAEKNQYIRQLQKQVRSLSAMLCYWRPLDEHNQQKSEEVNNSPKSRQMKELLKEQKVISNRFRVQSDQFGMESAISDNSYVGPQILRVENEHQRSMRMRMKDQEPVFKRTATDNRSNSLPGAVKQRPRKQCSRKHNESAKKSRKIDLNDIKQYGELLRYRLLGYNISLEMVRKLFDSKVEGQLEEGYLSMKAIKSILVAQPFLLKQEEATVVSRYIVEDSANQYVYWDQENQINSNVAKSIIKAFIGEYQLPDINSIHQEWQRIKKVYSANIMTALRMLAPKGAISLEKFIELIVGLGIQMSDSLRDWIIGEIVIKSNSLDQLKYEVIDKI